MTVLNTILTIVFIILSIVITVIILMQEGKSAGLGAIAGAADTYWEAVDYIGSFFHYIRRRSGYGRKV